MSEQRISPQAIVEPGAKVGKNVAIEPFAVIKKHVVLEDNVVVKSHAYLDGYTTVGEGTVIFPFASIGTKPQAIKYKGEKTFVKIGKNCEIREYVTINSSLTEGTSVEIGDGCFLMSYCHIAHNCSLGNGVVMANNATLAGHVIIEDFAIVGGMTPIHQHVRVGSYSMVGGFSRVPYDIPPYTLGAGVPYRMGGLNLVGLKRHGFPLEVRTELSKAFRILYRSKLKVDEAIARIQSELQPFPEIQHFVEFCKDSKRGIIGIHGVHEEEKGSLEEMRDRSQETAKTT